jgi:hypothetical protein
MKKEFECIGQGRKEDHGAWTLSEKKKIYFSGDFPSSKI